MILPPSGLLTGASSGRPGQERVVVVGGGYGGIAAAAAIERRHPGVEVVLVDARPRFFHQVAALRASARPEWAERLWIPRDRLLRRGRTVHGTVALVTDQGAVLADGSTLEADAAVVATGLRAAHVARPVDDDPRTTTQVLAQRAADIAAARSVVILGAGPVGLELAGEIRAAHPGVPVTVTDPGPTILPGPLGERLRRRVHAELERLNIQVLLGSGPVEADVVLHAFGAEAPKAVVGHHAVDERGCIRVEPTLRVHGYTRVFAVGDATDLAEQKLVVTAQRHAGVVAHNVGRVLAGRVPDRVWAPMRRPMLVLPLGERGGAGQLPLPGGPVVGARATRAIKGRTLFVDRYRKALGVDGR
ncbi:MAG: FAD-dependent oxidoreductase [Dermatophilaceae bacterium]